MSFARRFFFNLWYFRKPPWDTGISPPELVKFIQTHPAGRALDLGCGTGTNAIRLAQDGWKVTGIDFARRAIQIARRKARRLGQEVDFRVGDVTQPPGGSEPFDLILDIGCFHSLPEEAKRAYTSHLKGLLAPKGTLLLYGFLDESGGGGPGLFEAEIEALGSQLTLVSREDGKDPNQRPSVWLAFQK
jgi:SAM-dependent methyltransferase